MSKKEHKEKETEEKAKFQGKLPDTLGACADRMREIEEVVRRKQKPIDALWAEWSAIEAKLIKELPSSDAEGVLGKKARAVIDTQTIPTAEDWDQIWDYVQKKKAFELVQKRLNTKSVGERWEHGEAIPGVGKFVKKSVKITKR